MPPKDRIVLFALVAGGLPLVILSVWLQWFWADTSMDVHVYWEAGSRMLAGGEGLYDDAEDPANRVGYYIYPPFFAALFAPLTALPRWAGYALWALVQLALTAWSFRAARGLCAVPAGETARSFYIMLLAGIYGALWINLQEGQVNMLLLALIVTGLWQLERGKLVTGGLLLAAAAHLKVIPIVLLPILLAQKRFKAAACMAGGMALIWLLPLAYTVPQHGATEGWSVNAGLWTQYAQQVVSPRVEEQTSSDLGGHRAPNNSATAVAHRWFSDGHRLSLHRDDRSPLWAALPPALVKWSGLSLGALLGGLAMLLAWRTRESRHGRTIVMGLALLAAALANLLFWPHHLCLLLLVIAPLAAGAASQRLAAAGVVAAVVLCYLPLLDRVPAFDLMAVLGTPTLGVLMLWGAAAWYYRRPPA